MPNQPELLKILLPILLAIIIALLGLLFFIHRKRKRQQKNLNKTITELGSGGERKELDGSSNGSGMGRKGRVELMGDRGHTGELDGYNWKRELDGHEVAELAEKNSIMVGVRESKVQELGSGGSIREAMEEPGGGRRRSL